MNGPGADIRSRRQGDRGRLGRFRAFYLRWKDPVFAVVLPPTAIATFVIGLQVRSYSESRAKDAKVIRVIAQTQAKNAAATAKAARDGCLRSKALGPSLAQDYEIRKVLTGANLALYRSLIPKDCPKSP